MLQSPQHQQVEQQVYFHSGKFLYLFFSIFLGSTVISKVNSIEAIANCLYGADLKETVLQKMASELVKVSMLSMLVRIIIIPNIFQITMVTSSMALSSDEKTTISGVITSFDSLIISITKQIMVVQHDLSILIGAPYSFSLLEIEMINMVSIINIRVMKSKF